MTGSGAAMESGEVEVAELHSGGESIQNFI